MPNTKPVHIACGDGYIKAEIPERTRVIEAKRPLPAIPDIGEAIRNALANPVGHEPLARLVGPKSKVTIAFDDASGSYHRTSRTDFRQTAIEIIVEELRQAGVELGNIKLLLAQGLHRKLSRTEHEWKEREGQGN